MRSDYRRCVPADSLLGNLIWADAGTDGSSSDIAGAVTPLPTSLLTKALFQRFARANPPLTRMISFIILWWKLLLFSFPHQSWGGIVFMAYSPQSIIHESFYSEKCFLHSISRNKIFWDRVSLSFLSSNPWLSCLSISKTLTMNICHHAKNTPCYKTKGERRVEFPSHALGKTNSGFQESVHEGMRFVCYSLRPKAFASWESQCLFLRLLVNWTWSCILSRPFYLFKTTGCAY